MRIAVDSSVLLDVLTGDPQFGAASREALRRTYDTGVLVASDIVWSEVRAHFPEKSSFLSTLLSRDRGFFTDHFNGLRLIDPTEA